MSLMARIGTSVLVQSKHYFCTLNPTYSMQPSWLNELTEWLDGESDEFSQQLSTVFGRAEIDELNAVIETLLDKPLEDSSSQSRARRVLQLLANRLVMERQSQSAESDSLVAPESLEQLYARLLERDTTAAGHALQCLAAQADLDSLTTLANILGSNPPSDWQIVGLALSPLWHVRGKPLEWFFDRLIDSSLHHSTLAVLLDLANYAVRSGRLHQHPWCGKANDLTGLLRQVVVRLEKLQADPTQFGSTVDAVQQVLADSIALTVSLCLTLGMTGSAECKEVLVEAMQLSHRRIQAEAAAALARLGDEQGVARLVALAADPVCRSRVVNYAEELDLLGAIDEQFRFPQALAESDLAAWLASANQYGFPPTSIEPVEARTLYWPGYEEPRDCYLFRFVYQLPAGSFANIGISGPLTLAFQSDISQLSIDDQYAAFAGWQAEHEEIYEVPATEMNGSQRQEADRLAAILTSDDFQISSTIALTFLFGETALLARLIRNGQTFLGISDGLESVCVPVSDSPTAITPEVVLSIYRGRKLLKAFN